MSKTNSVRGGSGGKLQIRRVETLTATEKYHMARSFSVGWILELDGKRYPLTDLEGLQNFGDACAAMADQSHAKVQAKWRKIMIRKGRKPERARKAA